MPILDTPKQNHFLAALPAADYIRLLPCLERIELNYGRVLYQSGSNPDYVYFPTTSVVSLFWHGQDGSARSSAIIGNEGLVGIALSLGGHIPGCAVVQSPGVCYRLPANALQDAVGRRGEAQHLFLRFTQALVTQMAQTAVCNQRHSEEQQLCRWLLLSLDGLPVSQAPAQAVAHMPGAHRGTVAAAARTLHAAESVNYRSGRITVLDRLELERQVCECYGIVKKESERLLSRTTQALAVA